MAQKQERPEFSKVEKSDQNNPSFMPFGQKVSSPLSSTSESDPFLWQMNAPSAVTCSCTMKAILLGKLPVGLLPDNILFPDQESIDLFLNALNNLECTKYEGTSESQDVRSWGTPLMDAPSLEEHLKDTKSPAFMNLVSVPLANLWNHFRELGFNVAPLVDPMTNKEYRAGVVRKIQVGDQASLQSDESVLHVDVLSRDLGQKPDGRLPKVLQSYQHHQASFNILLDTGGVSPDSLFVYEKRYCAARHEKEVMNNQWQFPFSMVSNVRECKYTPQLGQGYVFSTNHFHDVRGGKANGNRITLGVFLIYIPELNLILPYS